MPEDLFAGTIRPKTQTHNKNLFPLYDETFTMYVVNINLIKVLKFKLCI